MPAAFATGWILPRIEGFHRVHAAIEIRIDSTTRQVEPDSDGIDAVIRHGRGGFGDLACWYLFGDQLVAVCSPTYLADRDTTRPLDLAGHTLLEALDASDDWPEWQRAHGMTAKGAARQLSFGDTRLAIDAALHGLGFALVDRHLIDAQLADGRLVAPFAAESWRRGTAWYFVHGSARQAEPPIRALREWLLGETEGSMP
jgi:LysR family glycine cleavage system transcriptional activator